MQTWKAQGLGIVWVTLLYNNPDGGPPTPADIDNWKAEYQRESAHIFADPGKSMGSYSQNIPLYTIVNPRTMQVEYIIDGLEQGEDFSDLVDIAEENMND